uniref:ATP-dependent RNA helicase TDRD9 n=1 Tax=Denticeps clupeoides TaxID=299321 RepID=A0AAY4CCJ2_9TELE
MQSAITAEQIADWFTVGTRFANIRITHEVHRDAEGPGAQPGWVPSGGRLGQLSSGLPPPPLATYEYPSLPITKNREELISLIESNAVVIIRGATGSGKTTQLPQFVLDFYSEKNVPCNLVVTQPRKIGAASIARWVARERKCVLGSLVGYQVGLEKKATEHTRLIYMTTGVLLQKLVTAKSLTEFSHIFIDEVHERTEELDFLLLVVRKLLQSNSRYVKVILMSATINCKEFADYFGTPVRGQINPAFVFEVEGVPYTIEEFYLDDIRTIVPFRPNQLDNPSISVEMYNVAVSLIQNFDEMEAKDHRSEKDASVSLPQRGSVLVFLPGLAEIQFMQEALAKLVRKRLQVYPLHSTVTLEEQTGVFLVPVSGYRKIILSTNIAESSVTVPDVKYVIDFCLARHVVCDKETNYQSLQLTWASKTNCNQRRGRAGRVSKGYCYRLVTKEFWEKEIPDFVLPEMLRSPLDRIMLKVKLLQMGEPRSVLSTSLSPPKLSDIERTILQLKEIGALSVHTSSHNSLDGDLTFLGRVLSHLPVDLLLGKMVVLGHVFGCLEECLIIAASLSLKSFFAISSLQHVAGYRSKLMFANGYPSDHIAFLNAFKVQPACRKRELEWGKENCIQIKRIREVAELFEDLKKRVAQFNMHINNSESPPDQNTQMFILQVVIAGAFYPNYFLQSEIDEELAFKELYGHNPCTTVMVRNLPSFAFLYYKQLQSLFRQCGQVKAISFDGSRAYVEFYRSSPRVVGVLPEVSLALLLSWQRPSMYLLTHSSDEVQAKAGGRSVSHLRYARVNVDFQTHSVEPVGVLSSVVDPKLLPSSRIFIVNITEVIEVGHFWGFQADEGSLEKQRELTTGINSGKLKPLPLSLYPNLYCLAPFSEAGQPTQYYRAKILHVTGTVAEVFFLDFGNSAHVSCSSLRELPADMLTPPFQAQEFCIAGMSPSAESLVTGGQWSSQARDRFLSLVCGRTLAVSLFSIQHGIMRVDLLVTTETSVTDIMVEEGYALRAPESFQSKQNHEMLVSVYQDLVDGSFIPSSISDSCYKKQQEDKELIDQLLETFTHRNNMAKSKVQVNGPYSPNKVRFHSMSRATHLRSVMLEKDSINAVAVNENPQDTHFRMLATGSVRVGASGSCIHLKETSHLPFIRGLPALVTMLFTPLMELRTDERRSCFTGAVCGLGPCSSDTKLDKDIELTFDVNFDVDDITEINGLRAAVNRLVCEGPGSLLHLGPDHISSLQQDSRNRLLRVFCRTPREDRVPVYYRNLKAWNQVNPAHKMEALEKAGVKRREGQLFQLHPVVLLDLGEPECDAAAPGE